MGEIAGKLENLLQGLDPEDPLSAVVWSEILRALPNGHELVQVIIETTKAEDGSIDQPRQAPVHKLLLVGEKAQYSQYFASLSKTFLVEIDLVDSGLSVRTKLANQKVPYDAAILDMDCLGSKQSLFELTKDIRLAQGPKSIPLSVVLPLQNSLMPEDLAYAGMSAVINKGSLERELESATATMVSAIHQDKPRILLVDDDEVLTKFLADLLSNTGMIVQILHKPINIVAAAESFNPDLVLLDVVMPGLSGYDVCRILRSTQKWQELPVLFLTSESDQVSRAAAFQSGGSDFLSKPVIAEEVLARVKTHLQNSLAKRKPLRDELTGALSSSAFINAASDLLMRAEAEKQPFTLCLISIEDFVKLSVQHGWYPMQTVVATLGELLKGRFRADDLRGRLAEDTFALAFRGDNKIAVEKVVSLLRNEFGDIKFSSDRVGHFKTIFSMGMAEYPSEGLTLKALLGAANQSLMNIKLSPTL